jgi:hypothetical protein
MRTALRRSAVLVVGFCLQLFAQQPRQSSNDSFSWSTPATRGALVRVRNIRGSVSVEASTGANVEVRALKLWRRGNPDAARISARVEGEDVVVCVLWGDATECSATVTNAQSRAVGDVSVQIVVKVPAGIRIAANTINGDVAVRSDARVVTAEAVNGNVVVLSSQGNVAAMTVNGSVTAFLTQPVNATLDLQASGRLRSEFPIRLTHAMKLGRVQGTIGGGGRKLELRAIRGDISLRRAGPG